jgi:hypothetical protein
MEARQYRVWWYVAYYSLSGTCASIVNWQCTHDSEIVTPTEGERGERGYEDDVKTVLHWKAETVGVHLSN